LKKNVVYLQFSGRTFLRFLLVFIFGLKGTNIGLLALPITVGGSNCWGVNRQRRYPPLKTKLKVIKNPHLQYQPQ